MEKLPTITINKVKYPYKCDLIVLESIQKEYRDIFEFERKLKGLEYQLDKNGNRLYDTDGTPIYDRVHFDIRALNLMLPLMINEGLQIDAWQTGKAVELVDSEEIIRKCDIPLYDLWGMAVEEYNRCIFGKKSAQSEQPKKSRSR